MKKNLMMRTGAIGMAAAVAFFAIIPDLVSAEGDALGPQTEIEISAELPETDISGDDTQETAEPWEGVADAEVPAEPEELPAEGPEVTEPEEELEEPEIPQEPSESETPDSDLEDKEEEDDSKDELPKDELPEEDKTEQEVPPVEEPVQPEEPIQPEIPVQPEEPQQPAQSQPDAAADSAAVMDTMDDYLEILEESELPEDKKDSIIRRFGPDADLSAYEELFESDEADFVIEGSVLVGYTGPGGVVKIPDSVTAIGDNAFAQA